MSRRRATAPYARRMGAVIAVARARAGLTKQALATRTGLDRSCVSSYERGLYLPRADTLDMLLDATGATPDERGEAVQAWRAGRAEVRRFGSRRQRRKRAGPATPAQAFGRALASLRVGAGYVSQAEWAEALGVSTRSAARWERGASLPWGGSLERALASCEATDGEAGEVRALWRAAWAVRGSPQAPTVAAVEVGAAA